MVGVLQQRLRSCRPRDIAASIARSPPYLPDAPDHAAASRSETIGVAAPVWGLADAELAAEYGAAA